MILKKKTKEKKKLNKIKTLKKEMVTQPAKYYAKDAENDKMSKSTKQSRTQDTLRNTERKMTIWTRTINQSTNDKIAKLNQVFILKSLNKWYNELKNLDEKIDGLVKKNRKILPYSVLKKVYDRGIDPHGKQDTDSSQHHNNGTFARVNSFVTKSSGTWSLQIKI